MSAIVGVVGCGVTGTRTATHLAAAGLRLAVLDTDRGAARRLAARTGAVVLDDAGDLVAVDLVALCHPAPHAPLAEQLLVAGVTVVSVGDDLDDSREMLALGSRQLPGTLVAGAAMGPGFTAEIARHLIRQMAMVDELHVALHGTGGPACARQHHRAMAGRSIGWHDDEWVERRGGSGRELCWFPDPIGARDCYRAELADPLLLQVAFPGVHRITARVSATRRDRLTARLPMLSPPHPQGRTGAVRVEVRGADEGGVRQALVAGASGPAGDIAAATCAATVLACVEHRLEPGVHVLGSASVAPLDLLARIGELGVRLQEFTGVPRATAW
jgi:hypothetical protein